MDSSVKNLQEVENDEQNRLRHQETPFRPKNSKWGLSSKILLLRNINRSRTKKFLIETILDMIDSSMKNPGEDEYDKQNWLERQKN